MDACVYDLPTAWRGHKLAVRSGLIRQHYREHCGPIPAGYHVHHACGDPACSSAAHLMAVAPPQHVREDRYRRLADGFAEVFPVG